MTKVDASLTTDGYKEQEYLTLTVLLKYYGMSDDAILQMPENSSAKYQEWVNNANRTVESALYKYQDAIPLNENSESFTYAKSMALHWAQYEKAAEEGSPNAQAKKDLWKMDKEHLIETLKAQPQQATTRQVTGSSFPDSSPLPYSQSWGAADIL